MTDCLNLPPDADHVRSHDAEQCVEGLQFRFQDAMEYHGRIHDDVSGAGAARGDGTDVEEAGGKPMSLSQVKTYESAMQYVTVIPSQPSFDPDNHLNDSVDDRVIDSTILRRAFVSAIQRCALTRTAFEIVARGESYEGLATKALGNGSFLDMMKGGVNERSTWSIRLRKYGAMNGYTRYGKNIRSSLSNERSAIASMAELLEGFRGQVDLKDPDCRIYALEGLRWCDLWPVSDDDEVVNGDDETRKNLPLLLARVVATGPTTSIYAPKTRVCVTTTPLCPIASFSLCNIARLSRVGKPAILDPFAGSCATLLAAAHVTTPSTSSQSASESDSEEVAPRREGCRSVAIEIAHDGYVNRNDIVEDFEARSLPPPLEIIHGDCLASDVRDRARAAIGGEPFDVIVTDPPYGIREAMSSRGGDDDSANEEEEEGSPYSPLTRLFHAMGRDRYEGKPLLKPGGRLAAFVPVRIGETLEDCLPNSIARREAGLVIEGEGKEQVLSDILSRWLVTFVCVG